MRTTGILSAILMDLAYRAIGIGLAYVVATQAAERIQTLYASIAAALPG